MAHDADRLQAYKRPSLFTTLDYKIKRLTDGCLYTAIMGSLTLISTLDWLIPPTFSLALLYLIPVGIASWTKGARAGILISLIAVFPLLAGIGHIEFAASIVQLVWDGGLFFSFMAIVAFLLDAVHQELQHTQEAYQDCEADRQRAEFISRHDALTGLPNRSSFHSALNRAIETARHTEQSFQVLFVDIDHFKHVNDSLGHYVGDLFLKGIAKTLESCIDPEQDILARLSGDEFGIISFRPAQAGELAQELIETMSDPIRIEEQSIAASVSIGVATYPKDGSTPAQLLVSADLAMYFAKQSGRETFRVYQKSLEIQAKRRNVIHRLLSDALAQDRLELHYQPIFQLGAARICAVETLLRLPNAGIALLTTEEMIGVAEETSLIFNVETWVLRAACHQAKVWHASHLPLPIAVNISSIHLKDPGFLTLVEQILQETGLDPAYLELEITERAVMESNEENQRILKALKDKGIRITVDDFGIGFSSLSYLKNFPVDTLKIDQFFIKGLPFDIQDKAITDAIIALAHGLKLNIVAEGVENKQQLDFLAAAGCDQCQGYFLSVPLTATAITEKIQGGEWSIDNHAPTHNRMAS
ncbi:putative bifunctional diguanylate cyclase/phosphodiesterase [Noviherbaspirillum sp.]|uniref:putative bifunctional diguanylate cyclase/phosphodiesterase n=1 Tax=Noviherbaspirillum sp. TaxID=1926288 RepID=UPI002B4A8D12|nr:EAL domain-containing protein [Noviherbaspirillum sp.]HJV79912.1 EAL domain-containing protein [Noviherbaspirillum sp.]